MKIQIFSDLHVDVRPIERITIQAGVDLLIVAGDTCEHEILWCSRFAHAENTRVEPAPRGETNRFWRALSAAWRS